MYRLIKYKFRSRVSLLNEEIHHLMITLIEVNYEDKC